MNYNGMLTVVGGALSRWLRPSDENGHENERAAARDAIAATLAMLPQCDEAVAVLAAHFGAEAWMADPAADARDALYDLAKWAQKSAVEAPTIPSKRRNAPPMGDDSGQID